MDFRLQAQTAHRLLQMRSLRWDYFKGEIFDEHGWNLLLILFAANADGRVISAEQAGVESGASKAAAGRWLRHLERESLIYLDQRGAWLTATTHAEMAEYLIKVAHLFEMPTDKPSGVSDVQDG